MIHRAVHFGATGSVALLLLFPVATAADAAAAHEPDAVAIQMRNVSFRLEHDIVLEIRSLQGQLRSTSANRPVSFDDVNSFSVAVDSANVGISARTLSRLLNSYVFAYPRSPLKNISIEFNGDRVKQKGTMHKGVDMPFELESSVSATADGNIRLHTEKIKSAHVPIKGLLHLLGDDLAKLINVNGARGVKIDGDDILLFPASLLPPPHMHGRVTEVFIRGDKLIERMESGAKMPALKPPVRALAYIYNRGGILRFGKLTMNDADLEMVGTTPKPPFEFCLPDYNRQLVAGYSKTTPSHGLVVHLPNYSQVKAPVNSVAPQDK